MRPIRFNKLRLLNGANQRPLTKPGSDCGSDRTVKCKYSPKKQTIMDSYSYYFLFPKCQTHAYTRFEIGCSENSTQKLLTKYSTVLSTALGRAQHLWHSFSQYGPPGRPITYTYANQSRFDETKRTSWSRLILSMCAWLSNRAN